MRFRGRVAIITGGASGIGRAAACLMAAEGGELALVDLDAGAMSPVARTIEAAGGAVASIAADVLDEGAVERMVQTVLSRFGRVVIPQMKRQGSGRIVNLSSVAARGDSPRSGAAYAAAKAGIRALTRKLAIELGPYGISCNAVAPSMTLSERIERRLWRQRTPEEQKAIVEAVPLKRVSTPEDQAKVILFLASDDAAFV